DLSGTDEQDVHAVLGERVAQAGVEGVEAGRGGAVDEVRAARPQAGGRAHGDDPAVALLLHLLPRSEEHTSEHQSRLDLVYSLLLRACHVVPSLPVALRIWTCPGRMSRTSTPCSESA